MALNRLLLVLLFWLFSEEVWFEATYYSTIAKRKMLRYVLGFRIFQIIQDNAVHIPCSCLHNISAVKCMSIYLAYSSVSFHNRNWMHCEHLGNMVWSKPTSVVYVADCWENKHSAAHLLVWLVPTSDQPPFNSSEVSASCCHAAFVHSVLFAWYIYLHTQVWVWDTFSGRPSLSHEFRSDQWTFKFWTAQTHKMVWLMSVFPY